MSLLCIFNPSTLKWNGNALLSCSITIYNIWIKSKTVYKPQIKGKNVLEKPMWPTELIELMTFLLENMTCNVRRQLVNFKWAHKFDELQLQ